MRPRSYIGITGFMQAKEVDAMLSVLPRDSDRLVMLGVLASGKTLRFQPNNWPQRYPRRENLGTIFAPCENVLNLIHYNTKEPEHLLEDMILAQSLAGKNCHGFQLNIAWPDKKVLADYRAQAPDTHRTIVVQCGGKAMSDVGMDPRRLAERIQEYDGLADYVLIDPSGGLGQEFDSNFAGKCFEQLEQAVPNIGFGVAGGLYDRNLDRKLSDLLEVFDFSIDVEGKLRNGQDDLLVRAAKEYLFTADRIYQRYRRGASRL